MYKVLIADKLSEEAVKIFKDNGIETVVKTGLSEEELIKELETCDGLVVIAVGPGTQICDVACGRRERSVAHRLATSLMSMSRPVTFHQSSLDADSKRRAKYLPLARTSILWSVSIL